MIDTSKAVLVGVKIKGNDDLSFNSSFEELRGLTKAVGAIIAGEMIQNRLRPEHSTFIGKGKIEELNNLVLELGADTIIFNTELSPAQIRNLQKAIGQANVVDRTMVILDIFSRRARSNEGKLQVELANLEYRLPRLAGHGQEMSKVAGGIGTRGLGEQQLELDRRYIRKRIQDLKKQMEKARKTRSLHRIKRQRAGIKTVSLVGYTNAGKSSLFNYICKYAHQSKSEQVEAENILFQTLDTTIRKINLNSDLPILISDSVGFIQNLPESLLAAFRSTLEEAVEADLLLHVADISDPDYLDKIRIVNKVIGELRADDVPMITVFNKADLLPEWPEANLNYISAREGKGIEQLINSIADTLRMN